MVLMNQQKIQLTQEGYDKLVAELDKLKNVDRIKNLEDLKEARAQGDLSENADYDAARDQQREIERKIKELELTLKNAVVITVSSTNLGKKIKFEVIGLDDADLFGDGEFLLVSSVESNPFDEKSPKISNESQIGAALMKANVGDVIQIVNDNVSFSIKVVSIK
jgi:transcription elongation factor GreA